MTRQTTALIGDETLLVGCGDQLLDRGHGIVAAVSGNAQVRDWAERKGVRLLDRIADVAEVGAFDWLFSIANLSLIPADVIGRATRGAVNFHDGPLPDRAGLNTPVWALLEGAEAHGITWHVMTDGIDRGDILVTREIAIGAGETAQSLNSKCYAAGLDSFAELLDQIESGRLAPRPQVFDRRRYFAGSRRPEAAGFLDLSRPADEVARMVRALDFGGYWNPLALPKLDLGGEVVYPRKAEVVPGTQTEDNAAGTVLNITAQAIDVACGDGVLRLSDIADGRGQAPDLRTLTDMGQALPLLTPSRARTLREAAQGLARNEGYWRGKLASANPVSVPLAGPGGAPDWTERELSMEACPSRAARIAVLAAWGAQGEHGARLASCDIAYRPARADADADGTLHVAAGWVPLRLDAGPEVTFSEITERMAAELSEVEARGAFARDLPLRDPALAGVRIPAIVVAEGDGAALPGVAVEARLNESGALALRFDTSRLDPGAIDLLTGRLTAMLDRIAAHDPASLSLGELTLLPGAERDLLLNEWNATACDFDPAMTIHRAFERQAAETPEATALVFEDRELSYAQLDARANALALRLQRAGVGRNVNVGLCVRRSPELVIGALAILKAGGAYVPLDPDHPPDRLAHILSDSGARIVVSHAATDATLPDTDAKIVRIAPDDVPDASAPRVDGGSRPEDLAYLIYTSGSTGQPKGVMVEHRNVANFFRAMDDTVDRDAGSVWMAVTSIAFDISVLELFYTLARGFKVVIGGDENRAAVSKGPIAVSDTPMEFSLYYWGNDDGPGPQKYQLLLDGARFADEHGFVAVWTPERHFHAFGGPYPNPSVSGAAVAAVTQNIAVRAGSCVAPLHHPARIAEDWAVIDNLTDGGAGLAFASGWHPDDFVLRPENTPPNNRQALFDALAQVRALWRGEAVAFPTQSGEMLPVKTLPRPVSKELECWVTTAGNPQTWREAGENGAHILTHLLGQSIEEVAEKIRIYHDALRRAGHDPAEFKVTVMLHTYIAGDRAIARDVARGPMKSYLRSAAGLIKQYAWAFPAFKRPEGVTSPFEMDLGALGDDEMEAILDFAFERYFEDAGLFGTVADGVARAEQLRRIGVTEIACLIDYGIAPDMVMEGLTPLAQVMRAANAPVKLAEDDFSLAAQILRHGVTHMQCTPSMARLLVGNDEARVALRRIKHLLLGGEALPRDLVDDLHAATPARITNMYGPTETTIWSTTQDVSAASGGHTVAIGRPVANTRVYVVDADGAPLPAGASGELCIGGAGVTRGYWQRDGLTADRFVPDPFSDSTGEPAPRLYRTGDLARWTANGVLEFLGRNDHQVKIRGQRIELGEIEACMTRVPGIAEAVVIPRGSDADTRLAGYYTCSEPVSEDTVRRHLRAFLSEAMVPSDLMQIEAIPLTPNKKVDRKALPAPTRRRAKPARAETGPGASETERRIAEIWARILGVPDIAPTDHFFDLGGHSLLAVQAHRDLRDALGQPGLSITDIFRFPVLRDLARHVDRSDSPGASGGQQGPQDNAPAPTDRAATMSKRRAMRASRERQPS